MFLFQWTITLLLVAVVLTALARRVGAPYPAFLAIVGAVLALLPSGPELTLDPELALALFVAPVLLDAAFDTSLRDLRRNRVPIAGLALGAVVVTTAAVAIVVRAMVPGIPWPAAIALGAIVAPPDAAAATAVLRQVRLPHRMLLILEGESLFNDATALLIYTFAVGAAVAGTFAAGRLLPVVVWVVVGSIAVGIAGARLFVRLTRRIEDIPSNTVLQFVGTFGMWILAERLGLSAVLTIVAFAITAAQRAPSLTPARQRVASYAVWDTAVFVLNVLAFVLVGLQARPIVARIAAGEAAGYLGVAAAVLATVIAARFAWVTTYVAIARRRLRRHADEAASRTLPTWRGALVLSWCGMRGIVTLAAALALPDGRPGHGEAPIVFPYRDLLVLTAFCVVLGTLVIQGLTLRPLLRRLALRVDDSVEREVGTARAQALRAALGSLDAESSPELAAEVAAMRHEYAEALYRATAATDGHVSRALPGDSARRRAVAAARATVLDLRARGVIGDTAFHQVEEELDRLELSTNDAE